ncbi:putative quinol monooxygenase [Halalkalibacter nanhaiisediminis]|uniref:Quinol monooxygenase YgiN n=1 Tax=Halalkalibacter nanhaiisediminis TaxID=688079 RepID=A0A562QTF4_9BACI|nr:antibiotic biosynthesis monooxygenase [Halalkalibacter nanhaiisediminis]TWI59997.1 quinol monooxygenase YgiN [Halalkalibacter nanhaiisediminis]
MVNVGLYVRLEAKPGKEGEIESFLRGSLPVVQAEEETVAWFALRLGPTTYGIFDAFPDDEGRQAHLAGLVAEELMNNAPDLFSQPPTIENVDILAVKLPGR